MSSEKEKTINALRVPVIFAVLISLIKVFESLTGISFAEFGVYPREVMGLKGILFSPLIHASFSHLFSNLIPIIILGFGLFYFYRESSYKVILSIYLITNFLVWIFGRSSFHIGSSGLVYGFASFIFFSGIIKRDSRSITLSLLVTFIYGGMVWGVLPVMEGISFESHLFGAVTGLCCAFIFRKKDKYKKYDWEDEEMDVPVDKLEIRYDRKF